MSDIYILNHKQKGEEAEQFLIFTHGCTTILDFKKRLELVTSIPVSKQLLLHSGNTLDNDHLIGEYNFQCQAPVLIDLFNSDYGYF